MLGQQIRFLEVAANNLWVLRQLVEQRGRAGLFSPDDQSIWQQIFAHRTRFHCRHLTPNAIAIAYIKQPNS